MSQAASIPPTDTSDEIQSNMHSLWIFGLVLLQLNLVSSLFVGFRTMHRWWKYSLPSLAHRLPLYFCILDLIQYGLYSATGITAITSNSLPSEESCRIIGGFICFTLIVNMFLVGLVAVATYLRVCQHIYFEFGAFDWKLLLVTTIPASITIGLSMSEFGPDTYWCYVKRTSLIVPLINALTFIASLIISAICYACVILALRRATSILPQTPLRPENFENQVSKKIISYVLMFLFNWVLALPYLWTFVSGNVSLVTFYLAAISCFWGGILNAIAYIYNEGFWVSDQSPWKWPRQPDGSQAEPPRRGWELDTEEVTLHLQEGKPIGGYGFEPRNSSSRENRWWEKPDDVIR